jgi:hypothetical protein
MITSRLDEQNWIAFNWQSPEKGHDRYLVTGNFAGVADGATPLDPTWPQNVGEFAEQILLATSQYAEVSGLEKGLESAIEQVHQSFDFQEPYLSSSIAVCAVFGNRVDYLSLGDCSIIYKLKSSDPKLLLDDSLERLDTKAYEIDNPLDRLELLKKHRMSLNSGRSDSYWTVSANPRAVQFAIKQSVQLDDLEWIFLGTDGFTRWAENRYDSLVSAVNYLSKHPDTVISLDQQKPISTERDSHSDDATGLLWVRT